MNVAADKDKVRLFLGVRVALETVAKLSDAVADLRGSASDAEIAVKWVAPASYHVTLKFLGWSRVEAISALRDRLDRDLVGARGFRFTTVGMGAFPSTAKARVLWAGIDDPRAGFSPLLATIETAVADLGWDRDKRAFHPHVTVGRTREVANLESVLLPCAEQNFSETFVESVLLFESVMKPGGSEYRVLAEWKLEPPSRGSKRQTGKLKPTLEDHKKDSREDGNGPDQGHK
jgi:2'-5' RNA ligase